MANFKVKIRESELAKFIDEKLDEIATDIFVSSQENIVNQNIIDEGTLLQSGNVNREFLNKQVIYAVPYADAIEFGRLPGSMPPVQPLIGWVRRNGIARDDKEARRIAFAIAKDIEKFGQDPRPFLQPAIEKVKAQRTI